MGRGLVSWMVMLGVALNTFSCLAFCFTCLPSPATHVSDAVQHQSPAKGSCPHQSEQRSSDRNSDRKASSSQCTDQAVLRSRPITAESRTPLTVCPDDLHARIADSCIHPLSILAACGDISILRSSFLSQLTATVIRV